MRNKNFIMHLTENYLNHVILDVIYHKIIKNIFEET